MLAALVLWLGSLSGTPAQRVDVIEFNTFGRGEISQVVFWDWSPDYRRYDCQGWVSEVSHVATVGKWTRVTLKSGLQVDGRIVKRSHTLIDPERENAKLFDPKFRKLKLW